MCKITESRAWKNVRRAFNKSDRATLLRNLRKVPYLRDNGGYIGASCLAELFVWHGTPQGYAYWKNWHNRYYEWLTSQLAADEDFVLPIY